MEVKVERVMMTTAAAAATPPLTSPSYALLLLMLLYTRVLMCWGAFLQSQDLSPMLSNNELQPVSKVTKL
jgi:hypothetical protein